MARPHMGNWASRPSSFQDPARDGSYMVEAVSEVSGDEFDRDDSDADDLDGYETAEESFVMSYCYNETNNNENSCEDYNNSEDSGKDYEGYDLVNEYSEQQIEDNDDFSTSSDKDNMDSLCCRQQKSWCLLRTRILERLSCFVRFWTVEQLEVLGRDLR